MPVFRESLRISAAKRKAMLDLNFESLALDDYECSDDGEFEIIPKPEATGASDSATATATRESKNATLIRYKVEVVKVRAAISACAVALSTSSGTSKDILVDGLQMLHDAHELFHVTKKTDEFNMIQIMFALRSIRPHFQRALSSTLAAITHTDDWYAQDIKDVEAEEYEISAVIWAVVIGPVGLAKRLRESENTTEVLMATEQTWVLANIGNEKYEEEKQVLENFADELCAWGAAVAGNVDGGEK